MDKTALEHACNAVPLHERFPPYVSADFGETGDDMSGPGASLLEDVNTAMAVLLRFMEDSHRRHNEISAEESGTRALTALHMLTGIVRKLDMLGKMM